MGTKIYFDVKGAAEYAGVDRRTIHNWIEKGVGLANGDRLHLSARFVCGLIEVNKIDLDGYLDELGYEPEEEENDEPTA